jgi:hypothetical protein|tara:strand:- start:111 stop:563 length:453 start_codon:yes stop_codon:yes gene_type:complete
MCCLVGEYNSMTWTSLSFSSGAILTASQTNAMQNNFTAVASQSAGAPVLASINRAWVVFSLNGHIMNSENVSSINHAQLGEYQISWATSFTASYGVTFGDVTPANASDPSVRGFRAFPNAASGVTVTYIAFNPSAVAKEDINGTVAAWQV